MITRLRRKCQAVDAGTVLSCMLLLVTLSACATSSTPADVPPPHADQLQMSVTSQPSKRLLFTVTTTDTTTIVGVQKQLMSLPIPGPNTSIICPANTFVYDTYTARFSAQGKVVEQTTAEATECSFWDITTSRGKVTRFGLSDSFWDSLHQLTGAPLPVEGPPPPQQ